MMYYTHLAFGLLVSFIFLHFFHLQNLLLFIIVVLFFSIFPDIDEPKSKIGRKNKILSHLINFIFGHRGIFHTIYIPLMLFFIFYNLSRMVAIASFLGCISHLFMDSLTRQGIKPLFPITSKRIYGFVKTNSLVEKLFFLAVLIFDIYFLVNYIK